MIGRLLTTKDVAERTTVVPATLRYWRAVGEGPASFKLGRRVVYTEAAVEEWLAEQQALATVRRAMAAGR